MAVSSKVCYYLLSWLWVNIMLKYYHNCKEFVYVTGFLLSEKTPAFLFTLKCFRIVNCQWNMTINWAKLNALHHSSAVDPSSITTTRQLNQFNNLLKGVKRRKASSTENCATRWGPAKLEVLLLDFYIFTFVDLVDSHGVTSTMKLWYFH